MQLGRLCGGKGEVGVQIGSLNSKNMKHILLIILMEMALLQPICAKEFKVGLAVTPVGENTVFYLTPGLVGTPGYYGDGFYTVGVTCQIPLTSRLEVETGFEYSKHSIIIHPNLPPDGEWDNTPYKTSFKFVSIPVTLNTKFLKYFFVNVGGLLDIDARTSGSIDNQTGLGIILGTGIKCDFKFGGSLFVNPYLKFHALFPFLWEGYHERLAESGVRIGVTYNLSR